MRVTFETLNAEFYRVLIDRRVPDDQATQCARLFSEATRAGIQSHGINRFPRFIEQLEAGDIIPDAQAELINSLGVIEQWDAKQSIGNVTAERMMNQALDIATKSGLGVVAVKNANHWMRGGAYGYQAAEQGFIGICFTNTVAVMPPWGGKDSRIGTNPLIIAIPGNPITMVDMSMSMFSYGQLEMHRLAERPLAVDGGFDDNGNPTKDPATLEKNRRILPMGYWKGSGLSIVLDMLATLLSGGLSVAEITEEQSDETCVSQVFMAIDVDQLISRGERDEKLQRITDFVTAAQQDESGAAIRLPGQNYAKTIEHSMTLGIEVDSSVWQRLTSL